MGERREAVIIDAIQTAAACLSFAAHMTRCLGFPSSRDASAKGDCWIGKLTKMSFLGDAHGLFLSGNYG